VDIEIQTHHRFLPFELLNQKSISINDSVELPGNAKLSYSGSLIRKSVGLPEIVNFTLTFGSEVVAGVVANWIYDKLKNKTEKISIDRKEIQLDKKEIKKIIEERIRIEK